MATATATRKKPPLRRSDDDRIEEKNKTHKKPKGEQHSHHSRFYRSLLLHFLLAIPIPSIHSKTSSVSINKKYSARRMLKSRKNPPIADDAVTLFQKQHVSFVPTSYGALQLGFFWRYNPNLVRLFLCVCLTELLLLFLS